MKYLIQEETGRLDRFLTEKLSESRSQLQKLIINKRILLNGEIASPSSKIKAGDIIEVDLETKAEKKINQQVIQKAEVIKKETDYLIVNKPAGLVVHNTASMSEYTLVDWLLEEYPELQGIGEDEFRPGIVHRLDKEVSGLMVIARNQKSFNNLKQQFKDRTIIKKYQGLVYGEIKEESGRIDFPIARATAGHKMAARPSNAEGRESITEFTVLKHFVNYTFVEVIIKTGRTHQIRAHFSATNHPLVGDNLYGTKMTRIKNKKLELGRIFLVAVELGFTNLKGKAVKYKIDLPKSLEELLKTVK
ncbi:MAG: RluA family pseudouridine synthase [bacterium]